MSAPKRFEFVDWLTLGLALLGLAIVGASRASGQEPQPTRAVPEAVTPLLDHQAYFAIAIRHDDHYRDSLQNLLAQLQRGGAREVSWDLEDGFWRVNGKIAKATLEPANHEFNLAEWQRGVGRGESQGTGLGPQLTIETPAAHITGHLEDLFGPWYRPKECHVSSNAIGDLCGILGVDTGTIHKIDARQRTQIAEALVLYWKSDGDLFCGGPTTRIEKGPPKPPPVKAAAPVPTIQPVPVVPRSSVPSFRSRNSGYLR